MDENNTEMNGIGKEESAFVSELEEAIGLPEKENASGTAEPESMKNKKSAVASVFDIVEMFSICAAVILLLFTFAVRLTVVDGPSMQNTLVAGDYLLVQELGYKYERGDIIVVQDPSAFGYTKPLVKRLIAVGGDTVDIDDHVELDPQTGEKKYVFTVKVNGEILDESAYIHLDEENYAKISTYSFPITVEEGKIFVLGDNRYHSADSRVQFPVSRKKRIRGFGGTLRRRLSDLGKCEGGTAAARSSLHCRKQLYRSRLAHGNARDDRDGIAGHRNFLPPCDGSDLRISRTG